MQILSRVARSFGRDGPRGVARAIGRRLTGTRIAHAYQDKTDAGNDLRWQAIAREIPGDAGSLLDLGSNLGVFTSRAAAQGLWAVGMEADAEIARRAQAVHQGVPNCAFMTSAVDLDVCRKIPDFDVVLVLSVHHHWHSNYGPEVAQDMLRALMARTRRLLIFEGPSRRVRYFGHGEPDFIDNDEASVTGYYDGFLKRTLGGLAKSIRNIGAAPCVGDREPLRWMYAITR